MKKYFLSFCALALALGMSAFTTETPKANAAMYYWYTPDGLTYLGHGENPSTGCSQVGFDCAKGYVVPPIDPVEDQAQEFRRVN